MTEGPANIPLAMLLVFGSAKVLGEISERIKLPAIVGEIFAGVLIGPGVLGWIAPNSVLTALADLGVMFLLFRVGLEVKTSELLRVGGVATAVAVLGVVAPFLTGWAIMAWWGAPRVEAFFVGAAMVATSVGITAQVLSAKGLLQLRASQVILAAAVIDDVLGLIVLAIVSSLARSRWNPWDLFLTALMASAFTIIVAKWGTLAAGHLLPRMEARVRSGEVQFNLAMLLLFSLALLASYAGVAAIVGAFLAGMALGETVGERVHLLTDGVAELLVPFFLVGIGLHFNPAALANRPMALLAATILAAAVISKLLGCGLGAISLGWPDIHRIGVGMVPRGEVGMVVAQIGLTMKVIPEPVYAVVVCMSVATTIIAPPLLNLAFRGAPHGPAVEEEFLLG